MLFFALGLYQSWLCIASFQLRIGGGCRYSILEILFEGPYLDIRAVLEFWTSHTLPVYIFALRPRFCHPILGLD
jgi:hypothetical protein